MATGVYIVFRKRATEAIMVETKLQQSVPGLLMRGGTSKGFVVRDADFDVPAGERDDAILDMFGSPDSHQIDGIGGGSSHSSKFVTVGQSESPNFDIEYTYAAVRVTERVISRVSISANMTSAVGMFAILAGLVDPRGDSATVAIYNRNTGMSLEQEVPTENGEPAIDGAYSMSGVRGTGAKITTKFLNSVGAVTGSLLPTGQAIDTLDVGPKPIDVSIVDAVRLVVFIRASDLDLEGTELPPEIGKRTDVSGIIEEIRKRVSELVGIKDAHTIVIVSDPQPYRCSNGERVDETDIDITARVVSLQPHHAIGVSPAMCLAAAAAVHGTIPAEFTRSIVDGQLVFGHPKGTINIGVEPAVDADAPMKCITNYRTARPLLAGEAFYRVR